MRALSAAAACLLSGVALALAFPDFNFAWLSMLALVPWALCLEPLLAAGTRRPLRRAFGRGWFFGLGLFGLGLFWIQRLPLKELTHPWVLVPGHLLLVSYASCYTGLASVAYCHLRRLRFPVALCVPIAWVGMEQFRSMGEMGFPWFDLGYAWFEHAPMLQWAAWGGVAAVGVWVAAANGLLAQAVLSRGARRAACLAAFAALPGLVFWSGREAIRGVPRGDSVQLAVIQPNIASDVKWDPRYLTQNLDVHLGMTREISQKQPPPSLVIWPETAVPSYLRYDGAALRAVLGVAQETRIPILTGFPDWRAGEGPSRAYNSAMVVHTDGTISEIYDKIHLVPFGERMPFQGLLPWLGKLDFGQAEFTPGSQPRPLESGAAKMGVLICFESIFTEPSAAEIRDGANLLVNITNDEWFGARAAPWQHGSMAVLRAVENRTGLVRCANTGVSFLVNPDGTLRDASRLFVRCAILDRVFLGRGGTFYTRHPDWLGQLLLWLVLGAGTWSTLGRRLTGRNQRAIM